MPSAHDTQVKEVFGEALDLPAAQRGAYLDQACAGNDAVRDAVESLLAAIEGKPEFLSAGTIKPEAREAAIGVEVGSRIGPYKLLQLIGEGGFGSVFVADQESPVRRRVALKIIKLGMDTRAVVARFEQERQALAMMDHPNIAKVLDAGATEAGRPYFVMELVKGDPITTYCDKNNLEIRERLDLFTQVCQAVQHAHTKGVIHRDIKPSNILVATQDGRALARVIDFGIAKATDHRLTEKTVFTEFRSLIGTPEYMSPEQAEGGLDIDTRTDVYSLGVLLYELLTGTTPFDPERLRSAAYGEMQRIIREVEPPKPSTRLSKSGDALQTAAARRRVEPRRLGTLVAGELDWIAMKALEKDRARRYQSPESLSADVARYLSGQSVSAAPPSTSYRLRKFISRHRAAAITIGLVFAALVLGVVSTSISLLHARQQRDRAVDAEQLATVRLNQAEKARKEADSARQEAERFNKIATAVSDFFTLDVLNLQPTPEGKPELTVREVLERIPEKIGQHFTAEPSVEGTIRERVGQLYLNMGQPLRAAEFLEQGASLLEKGLGPDHRRTLSARQRLGELYFDHERFSDAAAQFDRVYTARVRILGAEDPYTLNSLMRRGVARVLAGNVEQGLADAESGAAAFRRNTGAGSRHDLIARENLIEAYIDAGRLADAESNARSALEDVAKTPALAPAEADFRTLLGETLLLRDHPDQALTEFDRARELNAKRYQDDSPAQLNVTLMRARALRALKRLPEAAKAYETVYESHVLHFGAQAPRCRAIAKAMLDISSESNDVEQERLWRKRH